MRPHHPQSQSVANPVRHMVSTSLPFGTNSVVVFTFKGLNTEMLSENCVEEFERVLAAVMYHQKPGLLAFPNDLVHMPITGKMPDNVPLADPESDPAALSQAVDHIVSMMSDAKRACIVPGIIVQRIGLSALATKLVDATGLPFTTPYQDASTLDETHPNYMGIWQGTFVNSEVNDFVNSPYSGASHYVP